MVPRTLAAVLCMALSLVVTLPSAWAVAPAGRRGGTLTPADEAQQEFLRRLRRELAVQHVLQRQLEESSLVDGAFAAAPPSVQHQLAALTPAAVADATPSVRTPPLPAPSCVATVQLVFQRIDLIVRDHYAALLPDPSCTADSGAAIDAPSKS